MQFRYRSDLVSIIFVNDSFFIHVRIFYLLVESETAGIKQRDE